MKYRPSILFAAALSASLALAGQAFATTTYDAIHVGAFDNPTFATGLNNLGQVVGYGGSYAFISDANGQNFRLLDVSFGESVKAFGINDAGQVVGSFFDPSTGTIQAFATDANGANARKLDTADGVFAAARAINNDGQITGDARRGTTVQVFTTDVGSTGAVTYLPLPGPLNTGTAINASGQVAGGAGVLVDGSNHVIKPFVSGADAGLPANTTQVGGLYDISLAQGINDAGWLVGSYTNRNSGMSFAIVIGPDGAAPVILPKLHVNGQTDVAKDINNLGQIVGQGDLTGSGKRAFISDVNSLSVTDLNTLLNTAVPGVTFVDAVGINDLGQIAVTGSDSHIYLLNPVAVPEPSTVSFCLLGLAAGGLVARRHRKSRAAVLA